jgi:hypothetical protein
LSTNALGFVPISMCARMCLAEISDRNFLLLRVSHKNFGAARENDHRTGSPAHLNGTEHTPGLHADKPKPLLNALRNDQRFAIRRERETGRFTPDAEPRHLLALIAVDEDNLCPCDVQDKRGTTIRSEHQVAKTSAGMERCDNAQLGEGNNAHVGGRSDV